MNYVLRNKVSGQYMGDWFTPTGDLGNACTYGTVSAAEGDMPDVPMCPDCGSEVIGECQPQCSDPIQVWEVMHFDRVLADRRKVGRRFFLDCEFMESPGSIELLSIAFVSEDGQHELYLGNRHAEYNLANDWVKENVIPLLPPRPALTQRERASGAWLRADFWCGRFGLKEKILAFLKPTEDSKVELWSYYGAYDHVVLCWLFGVMMDLPVGMPMLTKDIKQLADMLGDPDLPEREGTAHNALHDAHWHREAFLFLKSRVPTLCL